LAKTAAWLTSTGRACFVYPEKRRTDLLAAAGESGLGVRRIRFVHPRADAPPNLFLVEMGHAVRTDVGNRTEAPGFETEPPLVLYGPDGQYTAEADAVFTGT
jgi:tRNA1Val (adenine37-N6)-methyltransferase